MEEQNIFNTIETLEKPSEGARKAVFSEIEFLQNATQILDLFSDKYFKAIISSVSPESKI